MNAPMKMFDALEAADRRREQERQAAVNAACAADEATQLDCGCYGACTCPPATCGTCGEPFGDGHTLNVCPDGHEPSLPDDDHDLRADMRRDDLGGWCP